MNNYKQEVAQKYARAYLNIYSSRINEEVICYIRQCSNFCARHMSKLYFVDLASVDDEVKNSVIQKIVVRYGINQFDELISLLIKERRIYLLPTIFDAIIKLFFERAGIILFEIASPQELEKSEREVLEKFLHNKTGKIIQARYVLDSSLIAGVSLKSSNYKWEFSVRKELARLATADYALRA